MKKIIVIFAILLALSLVFAAGVAFEKKRRAITPQPINPLTRRAEIGTAVLYGKIESLPSNPSGGEVGFRLVEWTLGMDNIEQAALEAGICSLEQIENSECLPGHVYFFARNTQKHLTLPLSPNVRAIVLSSGPDGLRLGKDHELLPRDTTLANLAEMLKSSYYADRTPFILTTKNGVIIQIEEQFVP